MDGYLIASAQGKFSIAAAPAEPLDPTDDDFGGPPSTDDEETDAVGELDSLSFANGKATRREGSFRKRSDEKIARAKIISSSLTSHLVTPAFNPRRVNIPEEAPATGSQTARIAPRGLNSEPGKQVTIEPLSIPPRKCGGGGGGATDDSAGGSFKRRTTPDARKKKTMGALSNLASAPGR